MPQLDPSSFYSQIFWLCVTFALLYILMARFALPAVGAVLQARKDKVSGSLEDAARLSEEAKELEAAYTASMAQNRLKASELIQATALKAEKETQAKQKDLDKSIEKRLDEAEAKMDSLRQKALGELEAQASATTAAVVKKVVALKLDKKELEKVVAATIKEKIA